MTAGKRYSAGAIFLQVVPVFANVQRAIEDEAKNIDRALGDKMEESGKKAGTRAGKAASKSMNEELAKGSGEFEREFHKNVDGINKALGGIDVKKLGNGLRKELTSVKRELAALKDVDLTVETNLRKVDQEFAILQGRIMAMRDTAKIVFRADFDQANRAAAKWLTVREKIEDPIELEVRTKRAEQDMTAFERSFKKTVDKAMSHLGNSSNKEIQALRARLQKMSDDIEMGVDLDAGAARAELAAVSAELRRLSLMSVDIDVKFEAGKAYAEAAGLNSVLDRLDGRRVNAKIDVDASKAKRSGDDAANSFRSFNIVLLAATSIGPALIPVLGGIAGGLAALGPAAAIGAAGIGSVLVGFSGLSGALQALGNQQDQAARTAQSSANAQKSAAYAIADAEDALADARRNAARAAEDAAERVADAREAAAEAIEDALERQKDAQEAYRDSLAEVRDAEQALREARREAADDGEEIGRAIRENQLALDQGLLDAFNATVAYNALQADGSATNAEQEQARINMEEAQLRLEELRAQQEDLAKQKRKWDKEGVDGAEEVERAEDALTDAIDAQKDAYEDLREAAKAVDEARVEGAENVREALEDQRETAADNARAIADAQEALARANEGYADSMAQVDAQAAAVDAAMDKLGPAGEKFARFLFGMRKGFYSFRDDIQSVMLPAVQQAIEGFLASENAGVAREALIGLAAAFGRFAKALSVSLQGEQWGAFFAMLRDVGPSISDAYGDAFISFLEAMATILVSAAPLAVSMAEGFAYMMDSFSDWTKGAEGQEAMSRFFGYVERIGPAVTDFFSALARAFGNIVVALAPWGELVLDVLTNFLDFIAGMDPDILGPILSAVIALVAASQYAYLAMNLIMAGAALFASPIGAAVFAIAALVGILAVLYTRNEDFRDFVDEAWAKISDAFIEAWHVIEPSLKDLGDAMMELWDALQPFFEWVATALVEWYSWYIPKAIHIWKLLFTGIAFWIRKWVIPMLNLWATVFRWLWDKILDPIIGWIRDHWDEMVLGMKLAWERNLRPTWNAIKAAAQFLWKYVIKPLFNAMKDDVERAFDRMKWVWENVLKPVFETIKDEVLPDLRDKFDTIVSAIGRIWDGLKKAVGAPIKFVVNTILNDGLIAGYNKVADFIGANEIEDIKLPGSFQKFATGGILPGYTPGRDVHRFTSPTGGGLELSGGEAIMRPEWTRAVGSDFVNQMNALARSGGVNAVRNAVFGNQAFASGGIVWPVPKGWYVNRTSYNLNHDGMDINHPNDTGNGQGGVVPFMSATGGKVNYVGYGRGYGLATFIASPYGELVYGHAYPGSTRTKSGQAVSPGQVLGLIGTTGNSSAPHLHFGYPGGTFYAAEALLDGAPSYGGGEIKKFGGGPEFPGWLIDVAKNPLGYVKDLVTGPIDRFKDRFGDSKLIQGLVDAPLNLVSSVKDKIWDILPSALKNVVKGADSVADNIGDGLDAVTPGDGVPGFANGGILPYNGTMKYDAGGYLPPGLTSVVNLTGKPEPVFTNEQWSEMGRSGGGEGGNIHYEPHFEGSDLTAEDVAADMNFTFRRIKRGGKYEGVGR